jgi:acyl carrier protein/NAD(P)-dependent dehydrogenase (short-subunit alcohol dehydrogenase family)
VLTRAAQAVRAEDPLAHPVSAAAWAAALSLTQPGGEAPQGVLDILALDEPTVRAVAASLGAGMVPAAIRDGRVLRMELDRFGESGGAARPVRDLVAGARAVVTGGSGALGRQLVAWLEEEGASSVASVSRRGLGGARAGIARVAVRDCRGDVAADALADLLRDGGQDPADFDMVFHLAGVDGSAANGLSRDGAAAVFGAKAGAIERLKGLIDGARKPLHIVLFSSLAALRGSQGQVAYSAANAAAAAALKRMVQGTPHRATVVHFGPWDGAGMAAAAELDAIFKWKGIERVAPEIALRALGLVLSAGHGESVIAQFPEARAAAAPAGAGLLTAEPVEGPSDALLSLRDIAPEDRRAVLVSQLRVMIAEVLETDVDEVDVAANLYDLGFDSLMAVELRNKLSEDYAIEVGLVILMDAQTIESVVDRLLPIVDRALRQEPRAEAALLREEAEIL